MPSQSDYPEDADVPEPVVDDKTYADEDEVGRANLPADVPYERLPKVRTHTFVYLESWAHAAELVVINHAYAVVGTGVGTLALKLEPGSYQVRQRIGYSEHVENLEVPTPGEDDFRVTLPRFEFPSPIPLAGTALVTSGMELRPFSLGSGNFRFVLWNPPEGGDVTRELPVERMVAQLARLRLESFDGKASHRLGDMYVLEEKQRALVIGMELPPGPYLVVQTMADGERQLCMPVVVLQDRITAVFCLTLSDDGEPISVQLAHAAIAILRMDEVDGDYLPSLFRLEAARKALSAGRRSYGWSVDFFRTRQDQTCPENVLLSLLDAQLAWKSRKPGSYNPAEPLSAQVLSLNYGYYLHQNLESASVALEDMRTDVIALYGPGEFDGSMPSLKAPPLLKRSWEQLLATDDGNRRAGELMAFNFQAEHSPTWFLWSELPGERAASFGNGSRTRWLDDPAHGIIINAPASDSVFDGGVATPTTLPPFKTMVGMGLKAILDFVRTPQPRKKLDAPTTLNSPTPMAVVVTLDDVVKMLAALLRDGDFQEWLNKAQTAYENEGMVIKDESMRRLIAGLRSLADPKLVEMLGAETIAQQVLASLKLPRSRVVQLVKALLNGVATRLAGPDRQAIVAVLHSAVDVAEAWLWAPPNEPPKQP
jgi:hypothetical protein